MGSRKVVKKKKIEPKLATNKDLPINHEQTVSFGLCIAKVDEAIECLKHYTKKDQIGDLANPAIELLTKWGIPLD